MIRVQDLIFDYRGRRAIHGVSFEIPAQSITALVGPNGAGKTTLMRAVAGLALPYAGSIFVDGIDVIADPRSAHRRIGFLQDFFGLYDDMTVAACLRYHADAQRVPRGLRDDRVAEVATKLDLAALLNQKAGMLSRGQRQRLAIGQAIIHKPRLLLLDEPASGLDPEARSGLSSVLRGLLAEGITLVVSSHILSELEDYSTHMMIFRNGQVVDFGAIEHLAGGDMANGRPVQRVRLRLAGPSEGLFDLLDAMPEVAGFSLGADHAELDFHGGVAEQHLLLRRLIAADIPVAGLTADAITLQDVYLRRAGEAG